MKLLSRRVTVGVAALCWIGTAGAVDIDKDACSPESQKQVYRQLFLNDQTLRVNDLRNIPPGDQAAFNRLVEKILRQDAQNQIILDDVVGRCGWPETEPFVDGNLEAAFFVIQHAPLAYMERYKDRIEKSYANGKIPKRNIDLFYQRLEFRRAEMNRAAPHG
jgi:hypothetical protein